jgi:hypothetical protein
MHLSFRNLFRVPHRATRSSARSDNTTRLHVEALEARDVPAVMNLTGYTFGLPGATLKVTGENVTTGVFAGTFTDATSGITISVNGHLQPFGLNLDTMDFQGVGTKGLETEQVVFKGDLHESLFPLMFGQLTETYSLPVARWTVSRPVETYGRPPIPPFPFAASQSAPIDAVFTDGTSDGVFVNPQPLPTGDFPSLSSPGT